MKKAIYLILGIAGIYLGLPVAKAFKEGFQEKNVKIETCRDGCKDNQLHENEYIAIKKLLKYSRKRPEELYRESKQYPGMIKFREGRIYSLNLYDIKFPAGLNGRYLSELIELNELFIGRTDIRRLPEELLDLPYLERIILMHNSNLKENDTTIKQLREKGKTVVYAK